MEPSIRITEALRQAIAAHRSGRLEHADRQYTAVLTLDRRNFDALHLLGLVRWQQGRYEEAASLIGDALRVDPRSAEACSNLGIVLEALGRPAEALAIYDRALAINPRYAKALSNRGDALRALHRFEEALASYDRALAIDPGLVEALLHRGVTLRALGRPAEALESFDAALGLEPNSATFQFNRQLLRLETCNWTGAEKFAQRMRDLILAGEAGVQPFACISYLSDPAIQLQCARNFANKLDQATPARGVPKQRPKLKIASLSADFRNHAVGRTIVELFELHDRTRFEVIGVSFGPDDGGELRSRLVRSFDQFHDVRSQSDQAAAAALNDRKIDIAIDLMGYTIHGRPGLLAH